MSEVLKPGRIVATLVVLLLVAGVVGWSLMRGDDGTRIEARFASTVGLYPGSDVQVLGVPIGQVTSVVPEGDTVRVTMQLDPGQQVAADTGAVIVAPTLVSDRYVQLTQPYDGGTALASGAVIWREHTAVPVEIDELYQSLTDVATTLGPEGANKHGALSRLLDVAADNLEGNGVDINRMIDEFGKASGTLARSDDDFFATLANLKQFNDMLVANDRGVASLNRQFATVTDYLADDRQELSAAIANLGQALAIVDDFIKDNRGHLRTSVQNLLGPTQVLVRQKDSLEESVRLIPLALQNFLNAYNAETNTVDGRGNLNELTIWSRNGLTAQTSEQAPPVLLPGVEETR